MYLCCSCVMSCCLTGIRGAEDERDRGAVRRGDRTCWYGLEQVITVKFTWMLDICAHATVEPVMRTDPEGKDAYVPRSGEGWR